MIKKVSFVLFAFIIIVLVLDAIGFMFWILSGQHPVDQFYVGSITANIIRALFF